MFRVKRCSPFSSATPGRRCSPASRPSAIRRRTGSTTGAKRCSEGLRDGLAPEPTTHSIGRPCRSRPGGGGRVRGIPPRSDSTFIPDTASGMLIGRCSHFRYRSICRQSRPAPRHAKPVSIGLVLPRVRSTPSAARATTSMPARAISAVRPVGSVLISAARRGAPARSVATMPIKCHRRASTCRHFSVHARIPAVRMSSER